MAIRQTLHVRKVKMPARHALSPISGCGSEPGMKITLTLIAAGLATVAAAAGVYISA